MRSISLKQNAFTWQLTVKLSDGFPDRVANQISINLMRHRPKDSSPVCGQIFECLFTIDSSHHALLDRPKQIPTNLIALTDTLTVERCVSAPRPWASKQLLNIFTFFHLERVIIMVLLGYNSIRTFEMTEEHIAAVTLHPDFGRMRVCAARCDGPD